MAAHSYWRINVTANDGDTSFLAIAEVEMRATVGGADQCAGGTASASATSAGFEADKAFDNDNTTRWSPPSGTLTGWLRYQFAAPVDVVEFTIRSHPTSGEGDRSPRDFTLEWSDDGSAWTVAKSFAEVTGWAAAETRTFSVTAVPKARVSQVAAEVLRTNTAVKARTSQLAVEVLRINTGTKIRTSQLAVEVLRPNAAAASTSRPVVFIAT